MKSLGILALGAVVALAPVQAAAWRAWNNYEVYPVSENVFEVLNEIGAGAMDFWCGAGDYAYRHMRTPGVQRIYIHRALGPSVTRPGKRAVQFSLTPPPGADTEPKLSLSVKAVGDNLRAAAAQQYCRSGDVEDPIFRRP